MTAWAVGLIEYATWPSRVDRTQARVTLGAHARHAGLLLIDTVETDGDPAADEAAMLRLREVLSQILAQKTHAVLLTNAVFDPTQLNPSWAPPTVIVVPLMPGASAAPPPAPGSTPT